MRMRKWATLLAAVFTLTACDTSRLI